MKLLLSIIMLLILAVLIALVVMGFMSRAGSAVGLVDGKLAPCPDKPNCVNSEFPTDQAHYMTALPIPNAEHSWQALQTVIRDLGGTVVKDDGHYLAATFRSKIFGFVDDVEARWDKDNQVIQLRSASRVGYSDRGVNKQRVEAIRTRWHSLE